MTPEQLFYGFPHPVPDVCWLLRDLVMEEAPDAIERVRPGWRRLGFELGALFCAVAPQRDHARLLFERGAELSDPEGLLQGTGTQVRYLAFRDVSEVDPEVIKRLVREAITLQR